MQDGIGVQGEIFWQINNRAGWKFSGKSTIVQVISIFETVIGIVKFILTCLLSLFFTNLDFLTKLQSSFKLGSLYFKL